ncbi:hypothetical protein BGZ96_003814 [Linnemannia gamsii]|uniref:Uncharacterized protein n=1 Tax=Linnemannia gamsii TaxID=64522 RepID=A0ABQ7K769_9FUNG|nr:hypothetical protein BGZ96_003814 [Linnemannia gamsii]
MSGNFNNNSNDPRFSQHRPFQTPQQQHNNSMFRPPTPAGQVPPFIDPRTLHGHNSNGSQYAPPSPNGRHPIPPVRFPGHQPQYGGGFPHNRPGAPPHVGGPPPVSGPRPVHQPHQFHQGGNQPYHPPPTGPAFQAMAHAQNMQNMHHVRTSSAGSNNNDSINSQRTNSPGPTSPTQPPNRQLPPIPIDNLANTMNVIDGAIKYGATMSSINTLTGNSSSNNNSSSSGASSTYKGGVATIDGGDEKSSPTNRSLRSEFADIKRNVEALRESSNDSELSKVVNRGVETVLAAQGTIAIGTAGIQQGIAIANKIVAEKGQAIVNSLESNPVLNHLVQLADKLVDIGKSVPFIAPAFVILKFIIDVEQKARDADVKCNDLLERINFMVSNLTVLERVPVIDPLIAVIERMNETLKRSASLIQAYRKQGKIARRLNMSNGANFVLMADNIAACSQDLMLSLQIQQTGELSVLSRSVPMDSQDEAAKKFVQANGGQDIINNNPALVEEFAKKMHMTMSSEVMGQMQTNMEDLISENQTRLEALLQENTSKTVAETIKAMASQAREHEAEQRLTCLQCDKEYRESANGPEACSFHKATKIEDSFSCCGKPSPCTYSNHRAVHHCEYPYTTFFRYVGAILGYVDTVQRWVEVSERDLVTDKEQSASVGRLIRWKSKHDRITKPMMFIHVGRVSYDNKYYFHVFDTEALRAANKKVQKTGNTVIFKSTDSHDEYGLVEWTLDDAGTINGVKVAVKVTTSDSPVISILPLDIDTVSLLGEVQSISKARFKVYKPTEPYKFPELRHVGPTLRTTALRETREFKPRTKLPLVIFPEGKMVANTHGQFVRSNADKFQGTLRLFNKSTLTNQDFVTLVSCKAEYRLVGEQEYKDVESLTLGDLKFPASIAPNQSLDVPFEAIVLRNAAQQALRQNCWNWAMVALHNPVRVRLTFKDIEGEELVYVQEYVHKPSHRMAAKEEKDLLFLYIDDMLDATRSVIRIKETDAPYVVDVNYTRFTVANLNKIVYQAERSGQTEVDLKCGRDAGSYKWDAWALVDLSCRRVYGFKMLLTTGSTREKRTTATLGYAPCPLYSTSSGDDGQTTDFLNVDDLEERPIQYAVETDVFPDVEPSEPLAVVEDDEVDDEKVVAVAVVAPVVAIAAATSTSVTAALSEVSKATASLDSAVFAGSMASLEKRLESLDTNVARMATALEKLVLILSQ